MSETPRQPFLERFDSASESNPIIGDGAMGTAIYQHGFEFESCFEALNLTHPDLVRDILQDYRQAGAEALETNSFCANAKKLKKHKLDHETESLNRRAAELAREVAGDSAYVLGSIGPLRDIDEELNPLGEIESWPLFAQQAAALTAGGADALILETFMQLDELVYAIRGCKEASELPIIAQMSYTNDETSPDGILIADGVERLLAEGADVIGANCLVGPALYLEVLARLRAAGAIRISCYPNAGYPQAVDGRFVYQTSPKYFGRVAKQLVSQGARLIGGCCGTTAQHVRAIAVAIRKHESAPLLRPERPRSIEFVEEQSESQEVSQVRPNLLATMQEPGFVTVEIEPPRGLALNGLLKNVEQLCAVGVDSFNVSDNPLATVHMESAIFAHHLRNRYGLPVIVHLTCRDRNLIGLQSYLLGAHTLKIDGILALTGDPASIGDQPGAKSVFNTNSVGLVRLIHQLNQGNPPSGYRMKKRTKFPVGVGANIHATNLEAEVKRLRRKLEAGAQFVQTQPFFSVDHLNQFLDATSDIEQPILIGMMPLMSARSAEFMHNEIPHIRIAKEVRVRLRELDNGDAEAYGEELVYGLAEAAKGRRGGAYLITPRRKFEIISRITKHIKQL